MRPAVLELAAQMGLLTDLQGQARLQLEGVCEGEVRVVEVS